MNQMQTSAPQTTAEQARVLPAVMANLNDFIGFLSHQVDELEKRLAPAVAPRPASQDQKPPEEPGPPCGALANQLKSNAYDVLRIAKRIEALTSFLDL